MHSGNRHLKKSSLQRTISAVEKEKLKLNTQLKDEEARIKVLTTQMIHSLRVENSWPASSKKDTSISQDREVTHP
eukprot:1394097-Amorphochlora_amoeboformis.AAC.2